MKKESGAALITALVVIVLVSFLGLQMFNEALLDVQMGAAQWSHEQQLSAGELLIDRLSKQSLDELFHCGPRSPCTVRSLNEKFSYSAHLLSDEPCQQLKGSTVVGVRYGVLNLIDVTRGFEGLVLQSVLDEPRPGGVVCKKIMSVRYANPSYILLVI